MSALQATQLAYIGTEVMGASLLHAIIEGRRLALGGATRDEQETDAALGRLQRSLAGVNFAEVALDALDANIFEQPLAAIDEQFTNHPLVRARLLQTVARTLNEDLAL